MTTNDRFAEAKAKCDAFIAGAQKKIDEFLADPQYRCRGCGAHCGAWVSGLGMDEQLRVVLGGVRYPGPDLVGWGEMTERFFGAIQANHMWCPDCRKKKDL
jgi:hypothetical protein